MASVKYGETEWAFGKRIVSLRASVVLGILLTTGLRSHDESTKEIKPKLQNSSICETCMILIRLPVLCVTFEHELHASSSYIDKGCRLAARTRCGNQTSTRQRCRAPLNLLEIELVTCIDPRYKATGLTCNPGSSPKRHG